MGNLRFGSLFAGIGGFDLGFHLAGMTAAWFAEVDERCNQVLAHRWPDVPNLGDVRNVGRDTEPVDVICGGFPCQDLSVAGKREGLSGKRSGLWFEFRRVLEELRPRWAVIENVPGLLSSYSGPEPPGDLQPGQRWESTEESDFGILLRGLVELGYGVSWRVFDAQFDGVAQRRRRVFIVGSLGDGRSAQVLFESESGCWDPPPSRETGTPIADGTISRALSRVGGGDDPGANKGAALIVAHETGQGWWNQAEISGTIRAEGENRPSRPSNIVVEPDVTHTLKGGKTGWCGSEDGTGRGTPIVAFDRTQSSVSGEVAGPLRACGAKSDGVNDGKADAQCVAFEPGNLTRRCGSQPNTQLVSTLGADKLGDTFPHLSGSFGVRRLTPTECERLQGFPDQWTAVDGMKDSPRYRMLGNAVAVPVAEWIGRRIVAVEEA